MGSACRTRRRFGGSWRWSTPDTESLDAVLVRAGVDAADALLDRLASSESLSLRRQTFDRIVGLGPGVVPLAVQRIEQPEAVPWYVLRNVLALLSVFDGLPHGFTPISMREHDNPQVRYEALKLSLRVPEEHDASVAIALSDSVGRIVALGVSAAEHGAPPSTEPQLLDVRARQRRRFGTSPPRDPGAGSVPDGYLPRPHCSNWQLRGADSCAPHHPRRRRRAVRHCKALKSNWSEDPEVRALVSLAIAAGDDALREAAQ